MVVSSCWYSCSAFSSSVRTALMSPTPSFSVSHCSRSEANKAVRTELEKAEHEYQQLETTIKDKQSSGQLPSEDDYNKLLQLLKKKETLQKQLEAQDEEEEKPAPKKSERRLLRKEVTEDEIAEVVSAWTGVP